MEVSLVRCTTSVVIPDTVFPGSDTQVACLFLSRYAWFWRALIPGAVAFGMNAVKGALTASRAAELKSIRVRVS